MSDSAGSWVVHRYGLRVSRALVDLIDFAGMADRLAARGRGDFEQDEMVRLAAEAVIHRIGEAVARLPQGFVDEFPDLRLRAFKGLRNVVAHRYHDVDYGIIWETITVDIPRLAGQIATIMERD